MTYSELEWNSIDNLHIYARYWKPDGDVKGTICGVHGLGEHSGRYTHLGEFFSANGFALLAADMRGHGKSEGQRGHTPSMDALREDVTKQVEEAQKQIPGSPIILYGHSLGGTLALSHCIRSQPQINGVIATGPLLRLGFNPPGWKLTLGKIMHSLMPTFSMPNGLDRDGLSRDRQVVHDYNSDPLVHDRVSAVLGIEMIEEGSWILENVEKLKISALLMHGSEDRLCSPQASREFAQKAGNLCTLKMWEGLYHEIHNEPEKDQVLQYALQWITETLHL